MASPTEFRGLLSVPDEDDHVICGLAGYAGLRSNEIDGTDWSRIDFDQGGVFVPDSKSEAGVRWVPMVAPLRKLFWRPGCARDDRRAVGWSRARSRR